MIHFMSFHEKQVERETIPPRVTREVPVEGVEVKVAIRRDGASDEAGSVIRHVTGQSSTDKKGRPHAIPRRSTLRIAN